ncbi:MAG: DUF2478 domain-containing protein [Lysobacteraceae bacterium]
MPDSVSAPPTAATSNKLPFAVVVQDGSEDADALLARFAASLRQSGRRVRGLIQPPRVPGQPRPMVIIDLDDENIRYDISNPRGANARGCLVSPSAVADASAVLRRARAEGADLVMVNRFGTLEASGGGLVAEMLELLSDSIPVLAVINPRYLEEWRSFTGGTGTELPPRIQALQAWFEQWSAQSARNNG